MDWVCGLLPESSWKRVQTLPRSVLARKRPCPLGGLQRCEQMVTQQQSLSAYWVSTPVLVLESRCQGIASL